jgi:hypothetical protein
MEFYLGNSNLVRDKWLVKKLLAYSKTKPQHCLPLGDFLEFNKIKVIFENFVLPANPTPLQPVRPRIIFEDEKNPGAPPTDNDVVLRGCYTGGAAHPEVRAAIDKLVMPFTRDVYHVNQPYKALSDAQKVQLVFLIKALKTSKVIKVCKD